MDSLRLEEIAAVTAPDGCTVLPLLSYPNGSVAHCTLAPGGVSAAVRHRVIPESWYFVSGNGEVWRRDPTSGNEHVDSASPGLSLTIPEAVEFQFRNTGTDPLVFLCFTMPAWPGEQVATVVPGRWEPRLG